MSQSALETGEWAKCIAFNLAGIKSAGKDGDWAFYTTREVASEAECDRLVAASTPAAPVRRFSKTEVFLDPPNPGCRFRAFSSLDDGVAFYLEFLFTRFSAAWPAVLTGDPFAFVHALKAHNYFTADEFEYLKGVVNRFDTYGTPKLPDMTAISDALASFGYDVSSIRDAVGAFQHDEGLNVDYTAGPMVRAKIRVRMALMQSTPPEAA